MSFKIILENSVSMELDEAPAPIPLSEKKTHEVLGKNTEAARKCREKLKKNRRKVAENFLN